jgi:hypothetical protein
MGAKRIWTAALEQLMRDKYANSSTADLLAAIGCNQSTLYAKASELGLKKSAEQRSMVMRKPGLRDDMAGELVRIGEPGVNLAEAWLLFAERDKETLRVTLDALVRQGRAGKVLGAAGLRWFATQLMADTWLAAQPKPAAPVVKDWPATAAAARLKREQRQAAALKDGKRKARAAADAAQPLVFTERTRYIEADPPPPGRYEPTEPVVGGFAADLPGQYAEPASGWAAAVVGGAA